MYHVEEPPSDEQVPKERVEEQISPAASTCSENIGKSTYRP